jgi:predicted RND superfamily exporter protein
MNEGMKKDERTFWEKLTAPVDIWLERLARYSTRHPLPLIAVWLVLAAVSLWQAAGLRLESDFEAMLPENYPSVQDLRTYQKNVGSTSTLSIALMTRDIAAAKRLAGDIDAALMKRMPDKVDYVEYNIRDVREFFRTHAFLFLDTKEIEEKYQKLNDYIGERKLKATGLLVDLDEEEEKEEEGAPVDLDRLFKEYSKKAARDYGTREDGYYINDKEDLLAMSVVPRPGFSGVAKARSLITGIRETIESLKPQSYAPDMSFGFAGPVQVSLDEYTAIRKDIVGTLGICIALVLGVLFLYFLRPRHLLLISLTLVAGITITMGITRIAIGFLNAQTAFLGSIIVGTGINYGIIFLARYVEERRGGREVEDAMVVSTIETWKATLAAALTTAAAFATLGLSRNLSFQHFGFIASTGVMIIWAATFLLLPAMTALSEKILPMVRTGRKYFEIPFMPGALARAILAHPTAVIVVWSLLGVAATVLIVRWVPGSLEYNFNNLRNKMTFQSGTEALDKRIVHEATHRSTSSTVAIVKNPDEAKAYCEALARKIKSDPKRYYAGNCITVSTFIPQDQAKKVELLKKIDDLLTRNRKLLTSDFREQVDRYAPMLKAGEIGIGSLPRLVRKRFADKQGRDGVIVLVKPGQVDLWKFENLHRFVETVRSVPLGKGRTVSATGSPIIFYDLVGTVAHDAPRDTVYAIVAVFLIILVIAWRWKDATAITTGLCIGVAVMVGAVAFFDVKINFFNFVAIPTAFGTGADYGINILVRYVSDRKKMDPREVLRNAMVRTGGAVFLCSSTTIIGYFSLMTSNNQALVSYGELAIAGEVACLLAAETLLPALLIKMKA